jgi:hypothetical protein
LRLNPNDNQGIRDLLMPRLIIPSYLLGRKKMPRFLPEYYSSGDESEAIFYAKENLEAWKIKPGALEWLLHQTKWNT